MGCGASQHGPAPKASGAAAPAPVAQPSAAAPAATAQAAAAPAAAPAATPVEAAPEAETNTPAEAAAPAPTSKPTFKIHAMSVSSNALPPVLFVKDAGLGDFEMCNLMEGAHKKPEYLLMNPFHQIPTLEGSNGISSGESNTILRYLAANHATQYYPEDAKLRARIDWAMDAVSTSFYTKWAEVVYPVLGFTKPPADHAKAITDLKASADCFASAFIGSEKFICGSTVTIADYKAIPFLFCLTQEVVQKKTGVKLSSRLEKYVADCVAVMPSTAMLNAFGGWSLKEYIASKHDAMPDYSGDVLVLGEAPDCAAAATGPAAGGETAAKIHGMTASANAMSAVLFAQDAGVGSLNMCNLMAGEHMSPEFLAKNPFHQIPTYEGSDGFCIGESGAMMRYMAVNYAPQFYPADPKQRVRCDWAIDAFATSIYNKAAVKIVYPILGFATAPADQTQANEDCRYVLECFEKAFLTNSKFVCGETVTIAEYKALPVLFALNQPVVAAKTGFKLAERFITYLNDIMAVVKSKNLLESAGGYSLGEYLASKA